MPATVTCTSCRARIDVPKDHDDPTIRCGICWTEVTLVAKPAPPHPTPALPVAQALPAKPVARPVAQLLPPAAPSKVGPKPSAVATPTKAAPGMAKLEGLIQKAATKLAAPVPAAVLPVVATAKPLVAEVVPLPAVQPKTAAPVAIPAAPVPIPQAPVPTPVRVPSSHPPVEVQPVANVVPPPVVVPVSLNSVPVVAPVPVTVEPIPVTPVPVTPARSNTTPDGAPVVQGEVAEDKPRSSSRSSEKTREPYKRRDDRRRRDDDDDDDRPPSREGKTQNGKMIAMIVGGVLLFVGLCVGGYFLSTAFRGNKSDLPPLAVAPINNNINVPMPAPAPLQFNFPDPNANQPNPFPPGFPQNPIPNIPQPQPNVPGFNAQPEWMEHAGDGFKVKVVGRPSESGSHIRMHDDAFFLYSGKGKHVRAATTPPAMTTEVSTADVPQGMTPDLKKIAGEPFGKAEAVTACKIADKDGWEYVDQGGGTRVVTTRVVQVGCRVFVFKFIALYPFGNKDTIDEAKKTFFESASISFDPNTPAPVDPTARPKRNNARPPRVDANPFPPPEPNARIFPGQDALKLAVRIDPFIAVVTFPDRGEAFTVGGRGNRQSLGGELRRYEYPSFKLKNTYFLPLPGTFAVGSDKTNRLAITTMAKADGFAEGERSIVAGDVQIFDLKPIFDDKVAQREELKPVATLVQSTGTRLAGLEVSPGGGTIYFLSLGRGTKPTKPLSFRINRADLVTGKMIGQVELPEPAWRLRIAADGSKLYAAEVPLNAAGNVNVLPNRATNIVTVDVERWQIERTDQLAAGTALDFFPAGADTLVASVMGNGNNHSLWAMKAADTAKGLDVPGQPPTSLGYVAATPDGKRLITSSAGRFSGDLVEVYDVTDWRSATGFTKIVSARLAKLIDQPGEAGVKVGHNFELTPDGKYAVFCETGAVVDLSAVGKR